MSSDILNTSILAVAFLALFAIAELLYHFAGVKAELTRKLVHFGTGALTLLFPVMLNSKWLVLFLCASFAMILLVSLKFNFLKSINAIDRKSHGSISYPVAVFAAYCFYEWFSSQKNQSFYTAFYLPVLTLAICDPIAALTGKRWPYLKFNVGNEKKSLMGSSMFFLSAFILCFALLVVRDEINVQMLFLISFCVALAAAVTEGISRNGLDNLTIPFVTGLTFYLLYVSLI